MLLLFPAAVVAVAAADNISAISATLVAAVAAADISAVWCVCCLMLLLLLLRQRFPLDDVISIAVDVPVSCDDARLFTLRGGLGPPVRVFDGGLGAS